jgi:hypothetical protein
MIDPMTALGGSSIGGAVIGTLLSLWQSSQSNKLEQSRILAREKQEINDQVITRDPYRAILFMLGATYCFCTCICFLCGDVPVATQGFGSEPTQTSLLFGLFERSSADKTVYFLTFAGLGTYFMSPLSFILTVKLTGITGRR